MLLPQAAGSSAAYYGHEDMWAQKEDDPTTAKEMEMCAPAPVLSNVCGLETSLYEERCMDKQAKARQM